MCLLIRLTKCLVPGWHESDSLNPHRHGSCRDARCPDSPDWEEGHGVSSKQGSHMSSDSLQCQSTRPRTAAKTNDSPRTLSPYNRARLRGWCQQACSHRVPGSVPGHYCRHFETRNSGKEIKCRNFERISHRKLIIAQNICTWQFSRRSPKICPHGWNPYSLRGIQTNGKQDYTTKQLA